MSADRQQIVIKLRQDHAYIVDLMQRITALCTQRETTENCEGCESGQRNICHENIGQLVRTFVEVTLRHNLIESAYMAELVPVAHRVAHNRAHMAIAEQLQAIRVIYAANGNGVLAIAAVERTIATIAAHLAEHDRELEAYLLAPV